MSVQSWDVWDAQYATLTSRRLRPEDCDHSRRSKYDSHVCFDCRADVGPGEDVSEQQRPNLSGGYIPGPEVCVPVQYIREVEPGLGVVSIGNGRPEYLISRQWINDNPGKMPVGEPPEAEGWRP